MKPAKFKINLLPKEELEERALSRFLQWSLTFGRYIIVGTEIIVLLAFFSRFKLDRQLTDLHQEISQKEAIVQYNQEFEKKVRSIQGQLEEISNLEKDYDLGLQLLGFLETNTPQEVSLEQLSFSQEKMTLSGKSLSSASFIDFLARIRNSGKFFQIILEDLSTTGETELKFKLAANINKENFKQ